MEVDFTIDLGNGHSIEFGNSSWDAAERSVRDRYMTRTGGFSPHQSSELPIDDVPLIVRECLNRNELPPDGITIILHAFVDYFMRSSTQITPLPATSTTTTDGET